MTTAVEMTQSGISMDCKSTATDALSKEKEIFVNMDF